MKEHEKVGQKQVSKVTLHFVGGHYSRKQTVSGVPPFNEIALSFCKTHAAVEGDFKGGHSVIHLTFREPL